jgi:3-deoxy-D-manno-octulosonic-acid transferase
MHFFFYEIIIRCLIPFALVRIFYRALMRPTHLKHFYERIGVYPKEKISLWENRQTIWFHCVSVGETKAIFNLIEILLKKYPKTYFLISHGTLTGRQTKLPNSPRIHRTYLPYDTSRATKNFLSYYRPNIGLILETELWFNLINQCKLNQIPLHLINARLSKNSLKKYLIFRKFINFRLLQLDSINVRTKEDANNFNYLTEANIKIMGNIKFEVKSPKDTQKKSKQLRKKLKITNQFVLVAGSTRSGEEEILLNLIKRLNSKELILVIVPRHPERFDEVEKIFKTQNLNIIRKSNLEKIEEVPKYVLGDTMGDLYEIYSIANLAIIGGSILDYGGQNPIEPMSLGIQTTVGPSIYNFKDMVNDAERNKAILRFKNIGQLEKIVKNLLAEKKIKQNILKNAHQYIKNSSGSTKKIIKLINQYL